MSIYSTSHDLKIFEDHNTSLYKISQLISPLTNAILDIGCSSGYLGQYIKENSKKKIKVDGIEIDEHDLKLAQKQLDNVYNIDIQNSSKLRKFDNKYDTIIFADVLEHTANPKKVLSCFLANLTKKGQILISIPNVAHQSVFLELLAGQWNYEDSGILDRTHLHYFDYNETVRIIEENGLYINKIDYSIFDIPHQKLSQILNVQGIINTKELIKLLKRPQHKIFQFIISASKEKPKGYKTLIDNTNILKPVSDWINEWEIIWKEYTKIKKFNNKINNISEENIINLKNMIFQMKRRNCNLKDKIGELESEMNKYKSSKFYKLYPIYEKAKKTIKLLKFKK